MDLAAGAPRRILDVGCGTGLLAAALAEAGHRVTGVDPAPEMLEVARTRPGGDRVEWVQAAAEDYRAPDELHLVIMTGNAFQALLSGDQVAGFLRNTRAALAADGRLVFETRNPALDWPARWHYRLELMTDEGPVRETREFVDLQDGVMTFDLHYGFPDGTLTSRSRIRFWTEDEVRSLVGGAELEVVSLHGDWRREDLDPRSAAEMVFTIGRRARA